MEIRSDVVQSLAHAGNLATFFGLQENAQMIFEAIRTVRPDNLYASIGLAVSKLFDRRFNEAIVILRDRVLKMEPTNLLANCYMGMALKHIGHSHEGERLLQEVIETAGGNNTDERIMALEILKGNDLLTRGTG